MKLETIFFTNKSYTIPKLGYAYNLTGEKCMMTNRRRNKAENDL